MNLKEKSKRENAATLMKGARKVVEKERKRLISKGVDEAELGDLEDAVKKEILKVIDAYRSYHLTSTSHYFFVYYCREITLTHNIFFILILCVSSIRSLLRPNRNDYSRRKQR